LTEAGAPRLAGFPPVVDAGCETLILGSFPGASSLAAGHYYAHPRNQFWPILSACLDEPLTRLDFAERYARLLAHRIALWDVIAACIRPGSLDADIREASANDLQDLLARAPALRRTDVFFNGATAEQLFQRHVNKQAFNGPLNLHRLPSTSPANAGMSYDQKREQWRLLTAALGMSAK